MTFVTVDLFYVTELETFISPLHKESPNYIQIYDSNENLEEKVSNRDSIKKDQDSPSMKPETSSTMIKSVNSLISNWSDALNDSSFSDMLVLSKNQRQIWVHKLVFLIRCPSILDDIKKCENERFPRIKESIDWEDIERSAALAFLEFIYCGVIRQHQQAITDETLQKQIRNLARKYRIKELFDYLRDQVDETVKAETKEETKPMEEKKTVYSTPKKSQQLTYVASPDMFDEEDEEAKDESSEDENEGNLMALLSLVNKDHPLTQSLKLDEESTKHVTLRKRDVTSEVKKDREKNLLRASSDIRAEIESMQKDIDRSLLDFSSSFEGTVKGPNSWINKNLFAKR